MSMNIHRIQKFVTVSDENGTAVTFTCLDWQEALSLVAKLERAVSFTTSKSAASLKSDDDGDAESIADHERELMTEAYDEAFAE